MYLLDTEHSQASTLPSIQHHHDAAFLEPGFTHHSSLPIIARGQITHSDPGEYVPDFLEWGCKRLYISTSSQRRHHQPQSVSFLYRYSHRDDPRIMLSRPLVHFYQACRYSSISVGGVKEYI